MAAVETIKQAITKVTVEVEKATIMIVHVESRRQAMGAGHHNTADSITPEPGGASLIWLVFNWNAETNV